LPADEKEAIVVADEAAREELRRSLEALEERMDARFEQVDARFGQIDEKIDHRFEVFEYKLLAALHQEIGMIRTDFAKQLIGQTKAFIFATTST
jgi:tetrahydromethanopterin S-methyltransferase subunit G